MKSFLFELCAESLQAARAAESGGADRIELCSQLAIGGITPDLQLIESAAQSLSIPVHVLIRPRGGDFVFSSEEFDLMRRQIEEAREAGAAGVAIGVLRADGCVDVDRSGELVEMSRPMKVTFHRAFDETRNVREALEAVIQTGADCLLTSGGEADVLAGAETIGRLCRQAGGRLDIMAGGGLRLSNLLEIVRRSGASFLHGSLTRRLADGEESNGNAAGNGHGKAGAAEMLEADVCEAVRLLSREFDQRETAARSGR